MLKAVIFDMDGVIVDSEPLNLMVDKRLLQEYGIAVSDDDLLPFVGISNPDMWSQLKIRFGLPDTLSNILHMHDRIKLELYKNVTIVPIAGIVPLLQQLKERGVATAIASSSPRLFIELIMERLSLQSFFQTYVSGEEVANGKPSPDIFLKAAGLLWAPPEACVVIEDSAHGVQAAAAAGMKCIGYANPHSGEQNLSDATCTVRGIAEIDCELLNRLVQM